ncbi:DUF1385 domain-containing protein [Candidatus Peregrinibacteria bacterium]|nr:DUF1385 domain-containing protein [Candidatus Peregrinibacteria bacterium]
MKEANKIDFAVGGQAVIEGVMMRSPNYTVVSVRKESGEIVEDKNFYQNISTRVKLLALPLVRGVINMFEMMYIGTKALTFSSKQAMEDLESENEKKAKSEKAENIGLIFSIIFSLIFSIFLFKFVPLWLTQIISNSSSIVEQNYVLFNFIDGIIKTAIFIGYIALLTMLPDIKRVFQYHGAEHKSIMTYEEGHELTVENAKKQPRFHPRCGTSFILIVFVSSIFVYTFVPKHPDFVINFVLRVAFLPIIAGVAYELLKLTAKHQSSAIFRIMTVPGLWMQRLTTKEPDDKMLEVALNSLKLSLQLEKEHAKDKPIR